MAVVISKAVTRVIHCEIQPPRLSDSESSRMPDQVRLVPRSRTYTLRSDVSSDSRRRGGVITKGMMTKMMRTRRRPRSPDDDHHQEINGGDDHGVVDHDHDHEVEYVLENMFESIEMLKKSYYFDIITGRLAMILFAVTMGVELATGDSIFKVIDAQEIAEGVLGCLAATTCATFFTRSSNVTQNKIGQIFTISVNTFFDALIDNIVDGLLSESDPDEPSDKNFKS